MSWNIDESFYPGPDESRNGIDVETVVGTNLSVVPITEPMTVSRWVLMDGKGNIVAQSSDTPETLTSGESITFTPTLSFTT